MSGRTLTDMPLNGRDTLDLALLQPGVTESNDDNNGAGNYSIAGGRSDSVTFLLDGGLNNDLLDNSNLLDPNPDAIAEFRLLTSNYTAEYGRNGGGIISVVTKSGTNQLHGSLFEFFRNRVLDANDYFNIQKGIPRLDLKRNQYGATLGGPILKDRMFFFLAYQGQRQIQAVPDVSPTFTPRELQGDFRNQRPMPMVIPPPIPGWLRSCRQTRFSRLIRPSKLRRLLIRPRSTAFPRLTSTMALYRPHPTVCFPPAWTRFTVPTN